MQNTKIEFNDWYLLQTPSVIKSSSVVNKQTAGAMYHVDRQIPEVFTPMLSRRAAMSENNTVPRVTVAPSILGCILGYSSLIYDISSSKVKDNKTVFYGGYHISEIDYEYCLKPNNKLVFDSSVTGEHWLVTYNKDTITYKPTSVGKIVVYSVSYINSDKIYPSIEYTLYIDNQKDEMLFYKDVVLNKGYHKVVVLQQSSNRNSIVSNDFTFTVENIDKSIYDGVKNTTAAMLSITPPNYSKW